MKEGYKLEDTIILNGKVGWVNTGDDADSIIGIQNIQKVKRFSGEEIVVSNDGFAFSKEMESRCGWHDRYASIQMLTGDTPIDMTFEEAKQRPDYRFRLTGIQLLIRDIREEHLEINLDNGPLIGKAVLEIGYVDIEVNISVLGMFNEIPTYKPTIEYFTCLKTENDWEPIEYIGTGADVDWWSNRWKEELEEDMFLALNEYVESAGLSYDEPN